MNRRTFIASVAGFTASVPFISMGKTHSELEDLYSFVESKHFLTLEGTIPFKLFPFQKQILKEIHENKLTVFIKGRQIGMTSLIAAYTAWHQRKRDCGLIHVSTPHRTLKDDWYSKFKTFGGDVASTFKIKNPEPPSFIICDEDPLVDFLRIVVDDHLGKCIITGTPDHHGNLKSVVNEIKSPRGKLHKYGFKIFHYPVTKCKELWPSEKYQYALTHSCRATELHANLV